MKLKRVITISFVVTCVSAASTRATQISVEHLYQKITSDDAVIALQLAVCGEYNSIADVNYDGTVTSLDALMILQAAAGHITFDK